MVSVTTATEVPGSEGKIERDGTFKVEVPVVDPGTYTLCLHTGLTSVALGTATLAEAGELKFQGDLGPMTLAAPAFVIHSGSDCAGPDAYLSGLTIL
ncbi:MAG TPA: hypothetical protein VNN07_09590 [Candidatus Tectomicrobia bacterium]|nr:hypothetical protein [Candidatus Tectomicrobia bacterium]